MTKFKIMNVLLSDAHQFVGCPLLLTRSDRQWRRSTEQDVWILDGPGSHDFTTYFNSLAVSKWKEYTVARDFFIHLELRGAACDVVQTTTNAFSWSSQEVEGTTIHVSESEEWSTLDVALTINPTDVCVAFKIVAEGPVQIKNSYYYVEVEQDQIRPVELALCTTTFKKEKFIERNIEHVKREILASSNLISKHFQMHVVDNGRTLDVEKLEGEGVTIHPNPNVGGAGGFARGMLEAMEQTPRATHALLMDDDVNVSPESIIRTFNILSLVNDDYVDAFISGAMLNLEEPNLRWEELGYMSFFGACRPLKPVSRMDVLHDVVANETFDNPYYMPECDDQAQEYAAWWYCVIPMTQIERNGLPLPIFVRGDDVEYSRRCKPKFIDMNSICIWHESFHLRYSAAQERYQMIRNCFIAQSTTNYAPLTDFLSEFERMVTLELRKFNYASAELAIKGFEDYLKGPEWIMQPVAEDAFMSANRNSEKLIPFEDLYDDALKLGVDLNELTDWKVYRDLPITEKEIRRYKKTFNGQRFSDSYVEKGKVAVIDNVGWAEPMGKIQHSEYIVSLDLPNRKGIIRTMDKERFKALKGRLRAALKDYSKRKNELDKSYSSALKEMTSVAFWKQYLGLK